MSPGHFFCEFFGFVYSESLELFKIFWCGMGKDGWGGFGFFFFKLFDEVIDT